MCLTHLLCQLPIKTTEKLRSVLWKAAACTIVHIQIIHFEISNRMKHQAIRTGRYNSFLVLSWQGGDLGGTDVLTTTGAALWYKQGEQSSLVMRINSLAVKCQGFMRYRLSQTVFQSKGSSAEVNST